MIINKTLLFRFAVGRNIITDSGWVPNVEAKIDIIRAPSLFLHDLVDHPYNATYSLDEEIRALGSAMWHAHTNVSDFSIKTFLDLKNEDVCQDQTIHNNDILNAIHREYPFTKTISLKNSSDIEFLNLLCDGYLSAKTNFPNGIDIPEEAEVLLHNLRKQAINDFSTNMSQYDILASIKDDTLNLERAI